MNGSILNVQMEKFVTLILLAVISVVLANRCHHRDYGHGASVCVCSELLQCEDLYLKVSTDKGVLTSYYTNKAGARFELKEYRFNATQPAGQFDAIVQLNRAIKYQNIIGFGGAFTDAAGINIAKLPKSLQTRLVKDYYGYGGIEYSLGRIPIGGSDFSTRAYSYDDHPLPSEDLSTFALQPEDFDYKLPYIRMAQEVSNHTVKYFGSSWSAPAWMKDNARLHLGGHLKGAPGGKYYKLFANYLVKFLREYAKHNVTMWGMTVQNEPLAVSPWNSLLLNATIERDFLKLDLGPELQNASFGDLKVMIYDHNLPSMLEYASTILEDKEASKFSAGVAFHFYEDAIGNFSHLDELAHKFPDKFLLATEACVEVGRNNFSMGNWAIFNLYAQDIIFDLNHYSSGWVDWNLVLDLQGGPNWKANYVYAPIIVNATSHEYYKQPFFFALGHFSKFLVPNSIRIEHTGKMAENNFVTTFERPDKSTVVTVLNMNNEPIKLQLHDPQRGFVVAQVMANSLESLIWY